MDEDVITILNDLGKSFENDEAWQKMESLMEIHNYSSSTIVSMLINYLNSENITSDTLSLSIINEFGKEKNFSVNKENMDVVDKKSYSSPNKSSVQADLTFLGEYFNDSDNIILPTQPLEDLNASLRENINFADTEADCIDLATPKFEEIHWPITIGSQSSYPILFQRNAEKNDVINRQSTNVISNQNRMLNASQTDNSKMMTVDSLSQIGETHLEEVTIAGRVVLNHSQSANRLESILEMDNELVGLESVMNDWESLCADSIALICPYNEEAIPEPLIVDRTESYSFFPGQNVMVTGKAPSKSGFIVSRVHQQLINEPPLIDPGAVPGSLFAVIASGPLVSRNRPNDLTCLKALIQSIQQHKCHVLVLTGPLLDHSEAYAQTVSCDISEQLWWTRFQDIAKACIEIGTHLVYVPSPDDCVTTQIFPQPPCVPPEEFAELASNALVHLAPNPAMISIGAYVFGVSSVDILRHLSSQEISKNCSSGRMKRLCSHILIQRSFYPLIPAHPEMLIDWPLWYSWCQFGSVTPHCLVLPSKLTTFKENVNNVLCINPGFIATDGRRSTCCRLSITRSTTQSQSITNQISCKIVEL